jgi:hypothetical protein
MPSSGANDLMVSGYTLSPQCEEILERIWEESQGELGEDEELLKKLCFVKFRDILLETVTEFNRSGEFVRIFPSKNSK